MTQALFLFCISPELCLKKRRMVWLLIFLSGMLILFLYLLLAPLHIDIDSRKDLYQVRFHRLLSFTVNTTENIVLELKMPGWKKQIHLSDPAFYQPRKAPETKKPAARKAPPDFKRLIAVLKSFKVKAFGISFDSGNRQVNGMLFPLFYFAGFYFRRNISISFTGETYVVLHLQNTLGRMAIAYI